MIIEVKQKHIAQGDYTTRACPVALALRDTLKNCDYISVEHDEIMVTLSGRTYAVGTPRSVERFVGKYDADVRNRSKVKPFRFKLNLPKP